jgi:hypothetical protein
MTLPRFAWIFAIDSEVLAEFRCCDKSFGCAFSEGAPALKAVLNPAMRKPRRRRF